MRLLYSLGRSLVALAAMVATSACSADDPIERPPIDPDAAPLPALAPPSLETMPSRTPLETVAARGTTEGTRVVSQGSTTGTVVTVVLPGGSFCQDAVLDQVGPTMLRYYAVAGDGRVSTPTDVEVTFDPSAQTPSNPTCSGSMTNCEEAEVCGGNGVDEDCDGWADACDTACNGCQDDGYEPNDFPSLVPSLLPGTYSLVLCPCRDDWFAWNVNQGARIRASASFDDIDIDLRLFRAGPEGQGVGQEVASSATTAAVEEIDWLVDQSGAYYLRVFPFAAADNPSGTYTLTVE